jgi:hypothetical protein
MPLWQKISQTKITADSNEIFSFVSPNLKLKDHLSSAVMDYLFNISAAIVNI